MDQQYIFPDEKLAQLRKYDEEMQQAHTHHTPEPESPAWLKDWLEEHPKDNIYTVAKFEELILSISEELIVQKDVAYRERNMVVLLAAWMCKQLGQVVGIKHHEGDDWDNEWRNIVFFEIHNAAGINAQLSWHIHEKELPMFEFLGRYDREWDGHTTEMKHMRILDLTKLHLHVCHVYFRDEDLKLVHVGSTNVWAASKDMAEGKALEAVWDDRINEPPVVEVFMVEDEEEDSDDAHTE